MTEFSGTEFSGAAILALITIMIWPVVPLFWIPVHCFPKTFRRLGLLTYLLPLALWLPIAYLIYANRTSLLQFAIHPPLALKIAGVVLLISGTALHIWTGRLLGLFGLMGLPEITARVEGRLVTDGAYSFVRHPTYLAHTLMFAGVFLMTGILATGAVTMLDYVVMNAVVIPLEERELAVRFGDAYVQYKKKVPKFFPRLPKN